MSLARFSVENGVPLSILLLTLLVLGGFSLLRIPQEQFPEVPFFWVNVIVPYPGASAADVEQSVTIKVENALQGIGRLKRLSSLTSDGVAVVRVEFDEGISNEEFARLYQDARTRFASVVLPDGTLSGVVDDFSSNDFLPVIEAVVSGEADHADLYRAARLLRDRFLNIPQVSSVELVGSGARVIYIDAERDRLDALGLGLQEIVRAVQQKNVNVPAGSAETATREYLVRTVGDLRSAGDFGQVIVRRDGSDGGLVRVEDVAKVVEGFEPRAARARFDGRPAILLRVAKVPRGNSIRVIAAVKAAASSLGARLPAGVRVDFQNDSSVQIRDSVDVLVANALQGLVLLSAILLVFLGSRNALMTALGIPLTFAVTFVILEALGETLNSSTLFGMVLVLGMVVDHAIVITENSYRLQQGGLSRREAAIQGAGQVMWPVVAASATTVAAFLPLMLLPGTIGKFLRVIPFTVSVALVVSTLEAIIFIPSHFAEWPGGAKKPRADLFDAIRRWFMPVFDAVYRRRALTLAAAGVVTAGASVLVPLIRQDLFSAEDYSLFSIDIDLAAGSNRTATERVVREFESRILPLRGNGEVVSVTSTIGTRTGEAGATSGSNTAQLVVDLTEQKEGRKRPIAAIMDEIKGLCSDVSGADRVLYRKAVNGPPVAPPVAFRLRGDDYGQLTEALLLLRERLLGYGQLFNFADTLDSGTPELRLRINQDRAAAYGLSTAAVGAFVRGTVDGFKAATVFFDNEERDVVVRYAHSRGAPSPADVASLRIPAADGRLIPFSAVAALEESAGPATIRRVDGKREVGLSAEAYRKDGIRALNADIKAYFETELSSRFPGLELVVGGEFSELADLLIQILRLFLIGVFLIYAVLGAQFRSYGQPFLILATIPFAFVGILFYLFASGTPFSTTVLYAGVALAGIAVNDSIVLIANVNERRRGGAPAREAVREAVSTRLRPIVLTSVTTMAGLLPTALGLGGYSVVWSPMAATIIVGLAFSTLTALFVIPSLYGLFADRGANVGSGVRRASAGEPVG